MTTPEHRPELGIQYDELTQMWRGACICGVGFEESSRSAARRVSRAHYNLADQDVPFDVPAGYWVTAGGDVQPTEPSGPATVASIVFTDTGSTIITTFSDGEPVTLDEAHPNFARILAALQSNGEIGHLLSTTPMFENLDANVEVREDGVYYGDWAIHSNLTDTIQRYPQEGRDTSNLVKFMERLLENPSENSREQLFTWAEAKDLTIDEDGFIIAFKAVTADMKSRSNGTAYVNGEEHTGQIPYQVGSVVSMPRTMVVDNPSVDCSRGLHVGTFRYASTFGPNIIQVKIDPANCVSVPRDCNFEKMRVCELEVLSVQPREKTRISDLWVHEPPAEEFDDTLDTLAEKEDIPQSWIQRMRSRFSARNRQMEERDDTD
jgi:hypothetical protein